MDTTTTATTTTATTTRDTQNSLAYSSPSLKVKKAPSLNFASGNNLLSTPRDRSGSLMGSKKAPLSSPNGITNEINNESADHFQVAGKRYKRKRPRVDDNSYQAVVSSYRQNPTKHAQTIEQKMALLEANCIWQGAEGGKGKGANPKKVTRYLEISKALSKPLYVASRAIEKNVASNSLLENEKALELLHNSKYNVNRAAFQLASTVGAGQELRYLRKNFAEDERTRRGVRSDIAAKKLDGGKSSKHGNSSRSSKSGLSDKEVKKLWTTWNAKARNILNRSDDSSGRFCFNTLKKLLMEAKKLPQVTLVPGSSQESFVKSAITHQRKIQDRILLVNQWTANAHDILAGMNKHLYSLEELEKLLHDAKSLKGFLEDTNHVDDIIHDIKEWVSSYNTMIKKSMSGKCIRIEVFESLLKKSHNFPVKVPEVDDLRMRLSEAVAQGMRIRRIFPEFWEFQISNKQRLADGASAKRKPSVEDVKELVEQVESIGIQTDELTVVKHALASTQEWIKRVNNLRRDKPNQSAETSNKGNFSGSSSHTGDSNDNCNNDGSPLAHAPRGSLKSFSALLQESKHLPIDVSAHSTKLAKALSEATMWVKKFKAALPKQNKTRGGEQKKAKLEMLTTLLDEAEDFLMMDSNNKNKNVVEDIRELVETANDWIEEAQEAIDNKISTIGDLNNLFKQGSDIPVEMDLLKVLETEIKRRKWTAKATKSLTSKPFETIEKLQELYEEIPAIRSLLPESMVAEDYYIEKEKEMRNTLTYCFEWAKRARHVLKSPGKGVQRKKQEKVTIEEISELIDQGSNITVNLDDDIQKLQKIKADSVVLQNRVNKMVKHVEMVKAHRLSHPIFPLDRMLSSSTVNSVSANGTDNTHDKFSVVIELRVLEKLLEDARKTQVKIVNTQKLLSELEVSSDWFIRAKNCLSKQQRNKSKPGRKLTKKEILDLCHETNNLAINVFNELKSITKEIEVAELIIKSADKLIMKSDKDMEEVLNEEFGNEQNATGSSSSNTTNTNIISGKIVTLEEDYLELFQESLDEAKANVAYLTPEVKLLTYRVNVLKWLRSVAPLIENDSSGTIQEVHRVLKRYEILKKDDEEPLYIPEVSESSKGYDGWRIIRHVKTVKLLTDRLLQSQLGAQEIDNFFKLKNGEAKPTMEKLEHLLKKAAGIPFLAKGSLTRLKSEARKGKNLQEKMERAINAEKLTLTKLRGLLKQHEKIAVYLPLVNRIDVEIQNAWNWDQSVRNAGIEQGNASIDHLRKLRDDGIKIRAVLDLMPMLNEIVQPWCLCGNTTDGQMFGCEKCGNWFHPDCADVPTENINDNFEYFCPRCSLRLSVIEIVQNITDSLSMYLNSKETKAFSTLQKSNTTSNGAATMNIATTDQANDTKVDHFRITGMGIVSYEVENYFHERCEEHFSMEKQYATEKLSNEEFVKFLELVSIARVEFLNILPSEEFRFDTEYYDSEKNVSNNDNLKKVAIHGKIGNGKLEELLMANANLYEHLSHQSSSIKNLIITGVDLIKWCSESLQNLKPTAPLHMDFLSKCNRVYESIIKREEKINYFSNPFKNVFQKSDRYKRSIRGSNNAMEKWFNEWDAWHVMRKIDIHGRNTKMESKSTEVNTELETPKTETGSDKSMTQGKSNSSSNGFSNGIFPTYSNTTIAPNDGVTILQIEEIQKPEPPPAYPGKFSTIENLVNKRRHIPVVLGFEFERLEKNMLKLKQYLELDKATYTRKPRSRKRKAKKVNHAEDKKKSKISNMENDKNKLKRKRESGGKKDGRGRPRKNSVGSKARVNPVGRPRKNSANNTSSVNPVGRPRKNSEAKLNKNPLEKSKKDTLITQTNEPKEIIGNLSTVVAPQSSGGIIAKIE